MTEISFTSGIQAVTQKAFGEAAVKIGSKNSVNYPWTINESIKAPAAYTKGICDCTMMGLTDGKDILMLHLTPMNESNHHFFSITQYIAQKMDLKNPDLQGILVGSKPTKRSQDIYNKFLEFFKKYSIPFSELKIGKDRIDVAYSSQTDSWLVASPKIDRLMKKGADSKTALEGCFNEVKIAPQDEIIK